MTFAAAVVWSLLRALMVAGAGVLIAMPLRRLMLSTQGHGRALLWALIVLPVFVPGLLVGYGYRNFSLSLIHSPLWNELAYAGLMLMMVVPAGTLILVCSPAPPVSPQAVHVARLAGRSTTGLSVRSLAFAVLPAGTAMFLLTFQETEVATLMQAEGWPEWIFTRLAAGLMLDDALQRLVWPILIQATMIIAAVAVVFSHASDRATSPATIAAGSPPQMFGWTYLGLAILGLLVIPGSIVLRGTMGGFAVLSAHPDLLRQIGIGLFFGLTSGLIAWLAGGVLVERWTRFGGLVASGLLLLPGLMGAWALGLVLASLIQSPMLQPLARTPLPMIIGEVLFQLPRAVLIRLMLGRLQSSTALHSARMLASAPDGLRRRRGGDLLWSLDLRGRVVGGMVVCYWAYMELSIPSSSLLAPPGMTSAPVLLYNQMHYGQIPGLSALVLVTLAVPVVCLCIASIVAPTLASFGWRQQEGIPGDDDQQHNASLSESPPSM